jgi:hypothetical protein
MASARKVLRWPAGFAVLALVFATAGSAPTPSLYARCRQMAQKSFDQYRDARNVSVAVLCERPAGTVVDPKLWWPAAAVAPSRPAPVPALTAGQPACVTGAGRPVAGTALTTVSATAKPGDALTYERQQLDGSDDVSSSGSPVLEFGPGDLAPGVSYRWRARVFSENPDDDEQAWSPWCEFTVSPAAIDYRKLGDVSLDALNELGLRPDRTYSVRLSTHQQHLLRTGTNVGHTHSRMTLTGPRWTDLLLQLTESASIADETAAEADDADPPPPNGTRYRTLASAISVKLGGPHHPHLD